jgi:YidC/Oxa1 family membrane protein insertase
LDSSRVLLAVILSIILVVAYQELVLKRFFPVTAQQQAAEQAKAAKDAKAAQGNALGNGQATASANGAAAPGAIGSAAATGQQSTAMTPSMALVPERTIEVDSDLYVAVFTTHGARLKSFKLNKYRQNADKNSPPYEMVQVPPGGHLPLGAVMTRAGNLVDDSDFSY